jgi:hypothetical protein
VRDSSRKQSSDKRKKNGNLRPKPPPAVWNASNFYGGIVRSSTSIDSERKKMKTHLVVSLDPLNFLSNGEMVGLCGAQVAHAKPVDTWKISETDTPNFNTLRDCSKCIARVLESVAQNGGKYYAYAIVPGEEAMHSGDTFDNLTRTVDRHFRDDCA